MCQQFGLCRAPSKCNNPRTGSSGQRQRFWLSWTVCTRRLLAQRPPTPAPSPREEVNAAGTRQCKQGTLQSKTHSGFDGLEPQRGWGSPKRTLIWHSMAAARRLLLRSAASGRELAASIEVAGLSQVVQQGSLPSQSSTGRLVVCTVPQNELSQDLSSIERNPSQAALGERQAVLGSCGERIMHQMLLQSLVDRHLRQHKWLS